MTKNWQATKMNQLSEEIVFTILCFIPLQQRIGAVLTINKYMYKLFLDATRLKMMPSTLEEMMVLCREQKPPIYQLKTIDLTMVNKSNPLVFGSLPQQQTDMNTFSFIETFLRQCKTIETLTIDNKTEFNQHILAEFINKCCVNIKRVIIRNFEWSPILRYSITNCTIIAYHSGFFPLYNLDNNNALNHNCKYIDIFPHQLKISCSEDPNFYNVSNITLQEFDHINSMYRHVG